MLLFYIYLQASSDVASDTTSTHEWASRSDTKTPEEEDKMFVILTYKTNKGEHPFLALPRNICQIFNLIPAMIESTSEESLLSEFTEKFNLPSDAQG